MQQKICPEWLARLPQTPSRPQLHTLCQRNSENSEHISFHQCVTFSQPLVWGCFHRIPILGNSPPNIRIGESVSPARRLRKTTFLPCQSKVPTHRKKRLRSNGTYLVIVGMQTVFPLGKVLWSSSSSGENCQEKKNLLRLS